MSLLKIYVNDFFYNFIDINSRMTIDFDVI